MRDHIHLTYTSIALEKTLPECRLLTNPDLCQRRVEGAWQDIIDKRKYPIA